MVLIVQVKLPVKALRLSTESFGHRRGFVRAAQRFCFCPGLPGMERKVTGLPSPTLGRIKECAHRARPYPYVEKLLRNFAAG